MTQQAKTYAELSDLISKKMLVPGTQYVLSDYKTKYQQPDTLVIKEMANERLVLTATSVSTFARICSSLDYPQDVVHYDFNSNTCEDGTTSRNGFILRRRDETAGANIDAPLDWRTILWARYKPDPSNYLKGTTTTPYSVWTNGAPQTGVIYKAGSALLIAFNTNVPASATDPNVFSTIYSDISVGMLRATNMKVASDGAQDIFLIKGDIHERPTFGTGCRNITFGEALYLKNGSTVYLPNNVFGDTCLDITIGSTIYENTFGNMNRSLHFDSDCYRNTFQNNCYHMSFGATCARNIFGDTCRDMVFGSNSCDNRFAGNCWMIQVGTGFINNYIGGSSAYITFGANCWGNILLFSISSCTFGSSCYNNLFKGADTGITFDSGCSANTFGIGCYQIKLGTVCNVNVFGNYCYNIDINANGNNNIFGNSCSVMTCGAEFRMNTFGDSCTRHTYGSCCIQNTYGTGCNDNTIGSYNRGNIFGNNKSNLQIKYMRDKNISGITALEGRNYTTTIESRNDNVIVYWSLNNSNVPVYATIA
jgi:hypothetical protein